MSRTQTRWRFFLAHQDPQQEAWFEAQARQGWHLERPGLFGFRFAKDAPREDRYRIDYQSLSGEKRTEYLALFRDAGWEFLGESSNRYYFRAQPGALAPEIFSDAESRKDRIRRELRVVGLVTAVVFWNTTMLGTRVLRPVAEGKASVHRLVDGIYPPALALSALVLVLLGWCLWRLAQALKREA
jgi:hypothetical protein